DTRQAIELFTHFVHDRPGIASLAPVGHADNGEAVVEVFDIAEAARRANNDSFQLTTVQHWCEPGFDLVAVNQEIVEGGAFRAADQNDVTATGLLWGALAGKLARQPYSSSDKGNEDRQHQQACLEHGCEQGPVETVGELQ